MQVKRGYLSSNGGQMITITNTAASAYGNGAYLLQANKRSPSIRMCDPITPTVTTDEVILNHAVIFLHLRNRQEYDPYVFHTTINRNEF